MPNSSYIDYLYHHPPEGWEMENPSTYHYFYFEAINSGWWVQYMKDHWYLAIYASLAYLIGIFGLKHYMRHRPAFTLKVPLFLWNLSLGIFSIFGFCRYLPAFLTMFRKPDGFYKSICVRSELTIPFAFWSILFVFSKLVELGDTMFLILRKRPVIFLQWYHHLATMVAVWILGKTCTVFVNSACLFV